MRTPPLWLLTLLALSVAFTGLEAQESGADLPTLLAEAEANNPEISAARERAEAAQARISPAGALPDPVLGVGVMNFPVTDPSLGRDMMTMTRLQISERFPFPGKLGLREREAELRAEAARWEVERMRREVVADVKEAYYRLYFIDRALDVTRRNENLLADFARLTSTSYGVGRAEQPDVLRAQVERTRLQEQLVSLREQRTAATARLNALLARPTDHPPPDTELPQAVRSAATEHGDRDVTFASNALAGLVDGSGADNEPDAFDVAELQQLALEHNPMILAHVRRVSAQERAVSLAGKATLPDFDVSVGYSHRPQFGDFVDLMVSVPLPIFAGRKQDQEVREEEAVLGDHRAQHHAMVNELNEKIAALVSELDRTRDQLVLLDEGTLPQARASLAAATASYRVGNVDFLTLLDSQVTLYRQELDEHRLLADFATNLARLERAVGTEVLR